jgi:hypothetical protein
MSFLAYLPPIIAISVDLLAGLVPAAISAFALAAALTILFVLSKFANVSKAYVVFVTVLVAASIGYNVFYYYPLVGGDPDALTALSVATAIIQTGHYSGFRQPTDSYYFPFPVMSIAPSMLSSLTGLDIQLSLLLFPGSLILLQPLLVFLISRLLFASAEAAALSALTVVMEATVTRFINQPFAQSVAISLLLVVLIALLGRSRGYVVVALTAFPILVALHAAVGLVSIVLISLLTVHERGAFRGNVRVLCVIFLGYLLAAGLIDTIVYRVGWDVKAFWEFVFGRTVGTIELFGAGANGIIFIWWGLPVSLGLFCVLIHRMKKEVFWAYAGLGLLGLSFAVNVVAPGLTMDRYAGLTGWFILAVVGGMVLSRLSRTSRGLLMLIPIIFLASLSGVLSPSVSPQYGLTEGYRGLPTTNTDRMALDWISHHVIGNVSGDFNCVGYLIFARYSSGVLSSLGIRNCKKCIPSEMDQGSALFIRWANPFIGVNRGQSCHGLGSALANREHNQIVNIVYDSSCDVLGADPLWMSGASPPPR